MVWAMVGISAFLLGVLAWGFFSKRRPRKSAYPLSPSDVAGAALVGRVWTNNDPLLAVDARAAEAWAAAEDDYDRLSGEQLEIGGVMAAILMPEIDEGPVDVFALGGGEVLLVSVTAADTDDWDEFLTAASRSPAREVAQVEVPSGTLAVFHATAPHSELTVVDAAAGGRGGTPFADELLAIPVSPGSYTVRESVVDAPSYALRLWRLTRLDI